MLSRVAELVAEVVMFLWEHESGELATLFDDDGFLWKVFNLADIFSLLNERSLSLQRKNISQIEAVEKLSALKKVILMENLSKKTVFSYVFIVR